MAEGTMYSEAWSPWKNAQSKAVYLARSRVGEDRESSPMSYRSGELQDRSTEQKGVSKGWRVLEAQGKAKYRARFCEILVKFTRENPFVCGWYLCSQHGLTLRKSDYIKRQGIGQRGTMKACG